MSDSVPRDFAPSEPIWNKFLDSVMLLS